MRQDRQTAVRLTESAIMLAFGTILSMVAIVQLPFGGSITAFSMLPIILIAYRYGTGWGLFTAFAYSLLQLLLGMNNLSYATSAGAVVAILMLDYVVPVTALGLGGLFRKALPTQAAALTAGTLLACVLRYVCHTIVGFTVWRDISIPADQALLYSLGYNATYMVPETLITIVGAVYLSKVLDFRSDTITRAAPQARVSDLAVLLSGLGKALMAFVGVFATVQVFRALQIDGGFDITNLSLVNWPLLVSVTVIGIVLGVALLVLAKRVPADNGTNLKPLFRVLPVVGVAAAGVYGVYEMVRTVQDAEGSLTGDTVIKLVVIAACLIAAVAWLALRAARGRQRQAG